VTGPPAGRAPDDPPPSVLILDHRASDREPLATVIAAEDYRVLEASTGEEALALAQAERPSLIIADILMPTMDGYEFVRALRVHEATSRVPVIFCTATYSADEVRRLAGACGVSRILVKPYEPEEIVRVVAEELSVPSEPAPQVPEEQFTREHLRILNAKLIEHVDKLEAANREQTRLHDELMRSERLTAESLTLLETLLSSAPIGFGFVDRDLCIRRMNERLAAVNGKPLEDQLGRTVAENMPELWPQLEPLYTWVLESGEAVVNRQTIGEPTADPGKTRYWLSSLYPVSLGDEIIGVGLIVVDITERKEAEVIQSIVMENMAEGMLVTDAEDRMTFMNPAASRLLGWSEHELRGKPLHAALHSHRDDGLVCRVDDCELLTAGARAETVVVAEDSFRRADGTVLPVAYSIAPLRAGSIARGGVVVFRDATGEHADRTRVRRELDALSWVGRTRDALSEGRLVLYSQPIVPLSDGNLSQELLLRMVDRDGDVIPPGRFLPAAEKYGLIEEIDQWVVAQAIRLAADGQRVEVNLSGESVGSAELLAVIERELRDTGAEASNVVFEITETALMRDVKAGEAFSHYLVKLGCKLALDDFGTGFGSFTYLKTLPVDYLKIDVEFVRNLGANLANQHLVKAIVNLARGFDKQTIAEGVEDEETLDMLRDYGVDLAQGFHLGRPAPVAAPSAGA
jgi:PAS domain S-box-containing protein